MSEANWQERAEVAEALVAEVRATNQHVRQWWAVRFARLEEWARKELSLEQQQRFFSICANGTATPDEAPSYATMLNRLRHDLERANAMLAEKTKGQLPQAPNTGIPK